MEKITIKLDSTVVNFYQNIAHQVNLPLERVLSDALFKLAGELSLNALHQKSFHLPNEKDA